MHREGVIMSLYGALDKLEQMLQNVVVLPNREKLYSTRTKLLSIIQKIESYNSYDVPSIETYNYMLSRAILGSIRFSTIHVNVLM